MINIFKLTRMVRINDKDVEDILCAAFEGGINYWCDDVTPIGDWLGEYASEHIANGGTAILHDAEEPGKKYRIDAGDIIRGVKLAIEGGFLDCGTVLDSDSWDVTCGLETSEIDAAAADVIVQLAVFGELIYG